MVLMPTSERGPWVFCQSSSCWLYPTFLLYANCFGTGQKGIATKRHKNHKVFPFLCFLCLFVANNSFVDVNCLHHFTRTETWPRRTTRSIQAEENSFRAPPS